MAVPRTSAAALLLSLVSAGCHLASAASRTEAPGAFGSECPQGSARFVPLAAYLERLRPGPLTVGLDVDDTALFSTPAFLYARGVLLPEPPADRGTPEDQLRAWREWYGGLEAQRSALFDALTGKAFEALTPAERARWETFWGDVTARGDRFSPPKVAVRALVRAHLRRGDRIVFVTGRPGVAGGALETKLRADFGSEAVSVVFSDMRPKDEILRRSGVVLYYSDSDGDMADAARAGASPVRILRSRYSSNSGKTSVGERGECFVIEGSEL